MCRRCAKWASKRVRLWDRERRSHVKVRWGCVAALRMRCCNSILALQVNMLKRAWTARRRRYIVSSRSTVCAIRVASDCSGWRRHGLCIAGQRSAQRQAGLCCATWNLVQCYRQLACRCGSVSKCRLVPPDESAAKATRKGPKSCQPAKLATCLRATIDTLHAAQYLTYAVSYS